MLEIAFMLTYLACCLVWLPLPQAIAMWLFALGCYMGIVTLTRSDGLLQALSWFARNRVMGAIILACSAIPTVAAIQDHAPAMEIALSWVLGVLWLWLPAAWATRSRAGSDG